jgi:hypothetical protein
MQDGMREVACRAFVEQTKIDVEWLPFSSFKKAILTTKEISCLLVQSVARLA